LSHKPGLDIALFFQSRLTVENIVSVYLTDCDANVNKTINSLFKDTSTRVFIGKEVIHSPEHINWFRNQNIDALISVYWPWLFQESIFKLAKITINFHPALLPTNRGWFPHVYNIVNKSIAGVTLHEIANEADAGDIWVQKEVDMFETDTSLELYERLQSEIVNLFRRSWDGIIENKIIKSSQDESKATYNSKKEISILDYIELEKNYSGRELVDLLRARSFGKKGFAYILVHGKKIFLNLRLSDSSDFN